jgi:peptidyl-tRNA hydrolase
VISSTRSQAFPRVRVGIGRPGKATVKNFVLQDFDRDEALALHQGSGEGAQSALDSACDMIDKWIDGDLPTSKNKSGNKQWKNKLAPVAAKDALYNGN